MLDFFKRKKGKDDVLSKVANPLGAEVENDCSEARGEIIADGLVESISGPSSSEEPGDECSSSFAQSQSATDINTTGQTGESSDSTEPGSEKDGWFSRIRQKLTKTREKLAGRLETVLATVREIDEDVLEELEEILITSDLGVETTEALLFKIRGQVARKELKDVQALKLALRERLEEMLTVPENKISDSEPLVIMVVGVNGVGKTTTIAKLTKRYLDEGRTVLLAAGDTFRAAAVEQLTIWAERLGCGIVAQPTGADPSAVVFDAINAAGARNIGVVIVDTAGRLHTKVGLMDELKKIKKVAGRAARGAPHETILVLDANTGQNAIRQAQTFHEAVGVDSLIVTKLDGTSKGGVIVSITNELKLPVKFIGLGENFDDLRPFDPKAFAGAILGTD